MYFTIIAAILIFMRRFISSLFIFRPRKELKELYGFSLLYSFASSLILIFEPIFFYSEGFSLAQIALYYAAHYAIYFLLLPLGTKFAGKFGMERSLSVSMPIFVVYFLLLASMSNAPWIFYLSWIILAVFKTFFWPAYNAEISKFGDKNNRGTEISWFYAVKMGVGVLGPVIGGFVVSVFGFPTLFIITAAMALFAAVPLLKTKENYRPRKIKYGEPWKIVTKSKDKTLRWGMIGWGSHLVNSVYWPIFMFILLSGATDLIGILVSVNVLVMTMLGFFIGEMSDRYSRKKIIKLNIPFFVISSLIRPLSNTTGNIWLADMLGKAAYIGVDIPMWHRLYSKAQSNSHIKYATAIEMVICVYKGITALALAAIFSLTLPYTGFLLAFALAGLLTIFYIKI